MNGTKKFKDNIFNGVFSRDSIERTIKKPESGIINLDDSLGAGTHCVCYYDNNYFNPLGMPPPIEVIRYIKDIQFNDILYQDTKSVVCGYYCLYFLKRLIMVIQLMIYYTKTLIMKVIWKTKVW